MGQTQSKACVNQNVEAWQCEADVVAYICLQYVHINKEKFKTGFFWAIYFVLFVWMNMCMFVWLCVGWEEKLPRLILWITLEYFKYFVYIIILVNIRKFIMVCYKSIVNWIKYKKLIFKTISSPCSFYSCILNRETDTARKRKRIVKGTSRDSFSCQVHTFYPSTPGRGRGISANSRPVWSTKQIPGHLGLV